MSETIPLLETDVDRARMLLDERDGELRDNIRGDVAALALAFRAVRREERAARLAAEERARRAEQALAPFARFDVPAACGTRDDSVFYGSNVTGTPTDLTVGDFRRARAVLRPPPAATETREPKP